MGLTPEGIGSTTAFGTPFDLGTLAFTTTGNANSGQADVFTNAALTAAESAVIATSAANGVAQRLVLVPNTPATAATYAGFSNTTATTPGPVLSLTTATAVPEPAAASAVAIAAALLARRRRRR